MFVGMSRLELRVPASGSLKAKRHVVKGLIGGLQSKFHVAVAEVGHQDLWQRASLGVACVSETSHHAQRMLHEVERWVARDDRVEILAYEIDIVSPEDQ